MFKFKHEGLVDSLMEPKEVLYLEDEEQPTIYLHLTNFL